MFNTVIPAETPFHPNHSKASSVSGPFQPITIARPQLELQGQLPIPDSLALNMAGTAASKLIWYDKVTTLATRA